MAWDFAEKTVDFLKYDSLVLDLGEKPGLLPLSLGHPREQLSLLPEGWEGGGLPFSDESFDLVLCCLGAFDLCEVKRVLKPGGFFLMEQRGAGTRPALPGLPPDYNLENQLPKIAEAGFRIMFRDQVYLSAAFGAETDHRFIVIAKKRA